MVRKGLGKGYGSGYFNIVPKDPFIHSLSARGIKSKQVYAKFVPHRKIGIKFPKETNLKRCVQVADELGISSLSMVYGKVKDYDDLVVGMDDKDLLAFQYYCYKMGLLNEKDFNAGLRDAYTLPEYPAITGKKYIKEMFDASNPKYLMDEKDYGVYENLPDKVTVYRGLQDEKANKKGFSWTLNPLTADFFANRWYNAGIQKHKKPILQSQIDKRYIYMYYNERNEEEIVLDYNYLGEIKEIEVKK
jgi:hypothetical protein